MSIGELQRTGKNVKIIHAGDYYVAGTGEIIGTILGSCVAVCFYDETMKIGGMNHFMLPGKITKADIDNDKSAKYGVYAIAYLLELMYKKGCKPENITARLFGGGNLLNFERSKNIINIQNSSLARSIMELEDIPIIGEDLGGKYMRKIYFDIETGKIFLRKSLRKDDFNFNEERDDEDI